MSHITQFEHLKIPLEAIKLATNNFSNDNCIGGGGFGKVYKGEISHSQRKKTVALKRLDRKFGQGDPEFWKEIMMLSLYKHENIVSLLGYCDDSGEKILVYEYAPNRSLELYIKNANLTWVLRLQICIGAARGLAYLHDGGGTQQRVLHRDVKSSNILLDENWKAKISDFGLSKFGPANQQNTILFSHPAGTPGYCDPLYIETGLLTKESDVYSFGVTLCEVLCGRLCFDKNQNPLAALVRDSYEQGTLNEIIYRNIKEEAYPSSLKTFSTIAYECLKIRRKERPLMTEIVKALETALQYQDPQTREVPVSPPPPPPPPPPPRVYFKGPPSPLPPPVRPSIPLKKTSLKPLHWVKVTKVSQGSLWDDNQKQEDQSKAPVFDMSELERLFSVTNVSDNSNKRGGVPRGSKINKPAKIHLVDLHRAYKCEIMLRKIKIPLPDMLNAILELDSTALDVDQIKKLIKFCPTKQETETLKNFTGNKEMLGKCELFFMELMQVPRLESKLRVFAFTITFTTQVSDLKRNLGVINDASTEVKGSAKLRQIMQTILTLGNALNQGTVRGSAKGFKLDTLRNLFDIRDTNNKITLMHYLCKILAEKMPELLDFDKDLVHLDDASNIQLKTLIEEMQAVSKGVEKVEQEFMASKDDGDISDGFRKALKGFLDTAEAEMRELASLDSKVGKDIYSLSLYFGEGPVYRPFEQVIQILVDFVVMFKKARNDNEKANAVQYQDPQTREVTREN